jgi:hypothetical protein
MGCGCGKSFSKPGGLTARNGVSAQQIQPTTVVNSAPVPPVLTLRKQVVRERV